MLLEISLNLIDPRWTMKTPAVVLTKMALLSSSKTPEMRCTP
jgi:hypothetical protein